jgi:hypothetical protein
LRNLFALQPISLIAIDIKKMNFTKVHQLQEIWCKHPSGLESH